ncbi:hypothetical protein FGE12_12640 [Aggregicoccus sp. 17bor-14]|uniref:carboxypeptidase regulatory-like domain-containing protein n=1 Tax=Myxococcaceae TaxID=31 RepID=UPI00129CCDE1|nr:MULTISPECIES: carboxypeptidase regulatory-like domain-containing protein [Myxococcaceae]MBF5043239.1 carboxypeptidase regulatory-like domain-containing protein [Simulacricoccus sp. 17bor-14]MRI88996.1 hypothetical protein [Aggregicoccus sp. 17bor-14]
MRLPACLLLALLALPAAARTRTVVGMVSDAAGRPVAGATVRVFQLPPDAPGWVPWQSCGAIDPVTKRSFSCEDEARLRIERVQKRRGQAREVAQTRTDAQGAFQLKGLPRGSYSLWAEDPVGGAGVALFTVPAEQALAVSLERSIARPLQVQDDAAQPLGGVTATLVAIPSGRFFVRRADSRGAVSLQGLPAGEYALVALQRGFLPEHLSLELPSTRGPLLTLYRPRSFIGHLHRAGVPVAGAEIALDGRPAARTNDEGLFALEGLRAGVHRLEAHVGRDFLREHVEVGGRLGSEPVDFELETLGHLVGRVVDAAGEAVPYAEVGLETSRQGGLPPFTADAQGRFQQWLEPDVYDVLARAPGRVSCAIKALSLQEAETKEATCTMGTQVAVRGQVVDPQGEPVPGVEIVASAAPTQWPPPSARTDAKGRFSLAGVGAGDVVLEAKKGSLLFARVQAHAPAEALVVKLQTLGSLTARVEDAHGKPLAGLPVLLGGPGLERHVELVLGAGVRQMSDAAGSVHFDGLPADAYEVTVQREVEGLRLEVRAQVHVQEGVSGRVLLRFAGTEGADRLRGRVVDAEGVGIAGAEVWVGSASGAERAADGTTRVTSGTTLTDASGHFASAPLPPGRFEVFASAEGYRPMDPLEVGRDEGALELVLARQHYVLARVVDAQGVPVPRVSVDGHAQGGPDGALRHPIYVDGIMKLRIGAPGFAEVERRIEVRVERDADLGEVTLGGGAALQGVVVASDGHTPVAGATVGLLDEKEDGQEFGTSTETRTNALGQFHFENVPEHLRLLRADAGARGAARLLVRDASQPLRLRLEENVTVQGRVLDQAGRPVSDAWVELACEQGQWGRTKTDSQGRYALQAAPRGTCTVRAEPPDAPSSSAPPPPAYAPVELRLPSAGSVQVELRPRQGKASLRVRLPGGNEFVQLALFRGGVALPREQAAMERLRRLALPEDPNLVFTGEDGLTYITNGPDTYVYRGLEPGAYTLIVTEESASGLRAQLYPVTLREGAEQTLSVPFPTAGTVLEP